MNDSDRAGTFNWGWRMVDVKAVPGIPCSGAQGLWTVPSSLLDIIKEVSGE